MAGSNKSDESGMKKGFAGLSSLVSDVDAAIADASKPAAQPAAPSKASSASTPSEPESRSSKPASTQRSDTSSEPQSAFSNAVMIVAALVAAVFIGAGLANIGSNPRSTDAGAASQTPSSTYTPASTLDVLESQPEMQQPELRPAEPSRPTEDRPPVGRNLVLYGAQIRYCVAEEIRIDAAKVVLDQYKDDHVDRFNAMVEDYNARCGEFRYREGTLQRERNAMEPYRGQVEREGRARITGSGRVNTKPSDDGWEVVEFPPPVIQPPNPTTLAIQRRLNELGYDAGVADGNEGPRTAAAISQFQKDHGFTPDGRPTQLLLIQINEFGTAPVVKAGFDGDRSANSSRFAASVPSEESVDDPGNLRICLSGKYPTLCNHSLLSARERERVANAERRAANR